MTVGSRAHSLYPSLPIKIEKIGAIQYQNLVTTRSRTDCFFIVCCISDLASQPNQLGQLIYKLLSYHIQPHRHVLITPILTHTLDRLLTITCITHTLDKLLTQHRHTSYHMQDYEDMCDVMITICHLPWHHLTISCHHDCLTPVVTEGQLFASIPPGLELCITDKISDTTLLP